MNWMDPMLHACMLWSAAAAGSLVAATWQGGVLAASIALCLRLLAGQRLLPMPGAGWRSLLWMATFLLVALFHVAALTPWRHASAAADEAGVLRISPVWGLAVACAWGTLTLYRAARLALSAVRLRGIWQRATPAPCDPACLALLRGGRRPVVLCTSLDVDRPSVIGFSSPRILLPPSLLAELAPAELEQVVLHELEHLRRADDWTNLLQKLVLVLFPLNAALLWIEHRLCAERELACDDGVLRRTRARKAYAGCLARLSEYSMVRRGASLALGAWERQSELSRRVYRILSQPEAQTRSRAAAAMTSLLGFLLLACAGMLAHLRPVVSFAAEPPEVAEQVSQPGFLPIENYAAPAHLSNVSMTVVGTGSKLQRAAVRHRHPGKVRARAAVAQTAEDRVFVRRPLTPRPWLVLAGWQQSVRHSSLPAREDIWPTFAAVPTGNGWLIIEL